MVRQSLYKGSPQYCQSPPGTTHIHSLQHSPCAVLHIHDCSVTASLSFSIPPPLSPSPPVLFPSGTHQSVLCIYQSVSVLSIVTYKTLVFLPIGNAGGQLNSHPHINKLSMNTVTHRGWLGFPDGNFQYAVKLGCLKTKWWADSFQSRAFIFGTWSLLYQFSRENDVAERYFHMAYFYNHCQTFNLVAIKIQ